MNRRAFFATLFALPAATLANPKSETWTQRRAPEWRARLRAMRDRLWAIAHAAPPRDPVAMAALEIVERDGDLMYQIRAQNEPDPRERAYYQERASQSCRPTVRRSQRTAD